MREYLEAIALLMILALLAFPILLFLLLAYERTQLAPRRSGGGTSSTEGFAPRRSPALPTPR